MLSPAQVIENDHLSSTELNTRELLLANSWVIRCPLRPLKSHCHRHSFEGRCGGRCK